MKILITGGAGFIGYSYAAHRLKKGNHVKIVDDLSRKGSRRRMDSLMHLGARVFRGELADFTPSESLRYDAVVHLAGQTAVTRSFDDPLSDFHANAWETLRLIDRFRKLGPPFPTFIYASTNKVYGCLVERGTIGEDYPVDLRTPYGISKGTGDFYCQEYGRHFGIPTIILRQSCVYGPYQTPESDQGWVMHFASSILQEQPITIFGDGRQVRDILHINDLLDLYDCLVESELPPGVVFNVGGGPHNAITVQNAVHLISNCSQKGVEVLYGPRRPDDQDYYISDIRKIGAATGWRPEIGAKPGLEMLVEWLQENKDWR